MSRQDLQRVEVLTEVLAGRRTTVSAAGVLGVSLRQAQRLLARYRAGGGGAMIHRSRGRPASNRLGPGVQEYVLELVRQNFRDFGPTLAAEALLERHGVEVSRETLRKWMVADGLWLSRKQRRSFHQPRLRRESYGELIQIDGSDHRCSSSAAIPAPCWCSSTTPPASSCSSASCPARAPTRTSKRCTVISETMAVLWRSNRTSTPSSA
jgi:transposase